MYLNDKAKKALENSIGINLSKLIRMDEEEEREFIYSKVGHRPVFSKKPDARMMGRGNPLIARRRICTMEDIDRRITELK